GAAGGVGGGGGAGRGAALGAGLGAQGPALGLGVESQGAVVEARMGLRAVLFSREGAAQVRALLDDVSRGMRTTSRAENEELHAEGKGVELYAPLHEYTYRVTAELGGPVGEVIAAASRLRHLGCEVSRIHLVAARCRGSALDGGAPRAQQPAPADLHQLVLVEAGGGGHVAGGTGEGQHVGVDVRVGAAATHDEVRVVVPHEEAEVLQHVAERGDAG